MIYTLSYTLTRSFSYLPSFNFNCRLHTISYTTPCNIPSNTHFYIPSFFTPFFIISSFCISYQLVECSQRKNQPTIRPTTTATTTTTTTISTPLIKFSTISPTSISTPTLTSTPTWISTSVATTTTNDERQRQSSTQSSQ